MVLYGPLIRWGAGLVFVLVACAILVRCGYDMGAGRVQAEWDASIARGQIEMARLDASYRAQEHRHAADMARIERETQDRLKEAGDEAYDRAVADVRAGRLRGPWSCLAAPSVPSAGPGAAGRHGEADDRAAAIGRVLRIGAEADQRLRDCQAVIRADRNQSGILPVER